MGSAQVGDGIHAATKRGLIQRGRTLLPLCALSVVTLPPSAWRPYHASFCSIAWWGLVLWACLLEKIGERRGEEQRRGEVRRLVREGKGREAKTRKGESDETCREREEQQRRGEETCKRREEKRREEKRSGKIGDK